MTTLGVTIGGVTTTGGFNLAPVLITVTSF